MIFFQLFTASLGSAVSWSTNGNLGTPRYNHSATLLSNGKVLVAGGINNNVYLASTELYDPASGKWSSAPGLLTNRAEHTATLLQNGKVLVVGGHFWQGFSEATLTNVEVFDPIAGRWSPASPLNTGRAGHTATLLQNGKLLVTGGYAYNPATFSSTNLASAELYDPNTGTWANVNPMSVPRSSHTATLLRSGKVLVAAGNYTNYLASAETFDPSTGTWSAAGTVPGARSQHSANLLPNGKVLLAGGVNGNALATAALYDPVANSWATANAMGSQRANFGLNILPNGKVLAVGGSYLLNIHSSAELYDPATGFWSTTASMAHKHSLPTATMLANGRIMVTGGYDLSGFDTVGVGGTDLYDSSADVWSSTAPMQSPRQQHSSTLLGNGKVLVAGGLADSGNNPTNGAELFDPDTSTYTLTGSMLAAHYAHTAALLPNGKVLLIDTGTNNSELYDPATGTWASAGPTPPLSGARATALLPDGRLLVCEGNNLDTVTNCFIYNPTNSTWTTNGGIINPRIGATITVLTNGNVLLAAGYNPFFGTQNGRLYQSEVYNPQTGTSILTGSMTYGRYNHTAQLLPNGKVIIMGGMGGTAAFPSSVTYLASCEIYDPVSNAWSNAGNMLTARESHVCALLPSGQVLVAAGHVDTGGSFPITYPLYTNSVEIFDPNTELWRAAPSMVFAPASTAVTLLPNGRALVNGGYTNSSFLGSPVTYSVMYNPGIGFASTNQPQITSSPGSAGRGSVLAISGAGLRGVSEASNSSGGNQSASDHPILQLRALESRLFAYPSATSWTTNGFTATVPSTFPIGYAMATIFVNGIPSTSALINIGTSVSAAPVLLLNPARLPNGSFQFSFTNTPGVQFIALGSSSLTNSQSNWVNLGAVSESAPGQFQFTDAAASSNGQRFYRVRSN